MWCAILPSGRHPTSRVCSSSRSFPCRPRRWSPTALRFRCRRRFRSSGSDIRFGKFSLADFFDNNIGGTDSHYQFLNWVIDNNGAYDYAADTRGYTIGAIIELDERNWALRFAETLMPKVANGPDLDADVARARAENIELELRPQLVKKKDTTIRLLSYINHGNMGNYEEAVRLYLDHVTPTPDVSATAKQGTIKYGFGINFEQEFGKDSYALRTLGME